MLRRILGAILFLTVLAATSWGQATPVLSKVPSATDTQISGVAQGLAPDYETILLYVCTSDTATAPVNCSAEDTKNGRKRTLVNIGGSPYTVSASDGKFTITMASSLTQGTYIWIVQITRLSTDHSEIVKMSTPVRVPVPLLGKFSVSLSGFDSASRDVGGKVSLRLDHGLQSEGWGATEFLAGGTYDDKWKHTALSSNVTHNYFADLYQLRQLNSTTAWGPYGKAYHNNTQGIVVEQTYGAGITHVIVLPKAYYLSLSAGMQAMLDNLYTPGKSTNLGAAHLGTEITHDFANKISIDVQAGATPVFTQDRAWSASGDFRLDIPISKRWSFQFEIVDNYYEIAPKGFNKNYLAPSIGLSFK